MTTLGGALRPTQNEGEPGKGRGGKAIDVDTAPPPDFTRGPFSPLALARHFSFFRPHLYNHIMSCTSCRCPCVDLSMFITLMFLSRSAIPTNDPAVPALFRVDYRLRYAI